MMSLNQTNFILVGIVHDVGPLSQHKWVTQTIADGKCHLLWTKLLGVVFLGKVVLTRVTTDKRKQHGEKLRCLPLGEQGVREGECWIRVLTWRSKGTLLKSESRVLKEASETEKIHLGFLCSDWKCYIVGLVPRSLLQELANIWVLKGWSEAQEPALWPRPQGMLVLAGPGRCLGKSFPGLKSMHTSMAGASSMHTEHGDRTWTWCTVATGGKDMSSWGVGRSVVLCSGATTSWHAEAMRVSQNTYS